mmetsp:Transcript_15793/g.18265  ORF Transcript_15793/g.18265 Transcript_15793/m.18265 type:complete len:120 (-) Transcript_15793:26-385(-)
MVVIKLMMDAGTFILKTCDGPFYSRYRRDFIHVCVRFYKILYSLDKATEDHAESKISKTIKRSISKALNKLQTSEGHMKEIKSKIYSTSKSKQMVGFYRTEYQNYTAKSKLLDADQVYV